jgi:hypothetical protein
MFRMTDLAVGALPSARGPCYHLTHCWAASIQCYHTGPVTEAWYHPTLCYAPSVPCHGPYSGPVAEAGFQGYACPYPGAYGNMYPAAGQSPAMQPMQAGGPMQPMQGWPPGQGWPPMHPIQAGPYGAAPNMPVWCDPGPQMHPPPMQAWQPMQAGPYGAAPNMPVWCDPGPQMQPPPMQAPYPYPGAPQAMMPEMLRAGIPPYCDPPTNFCPGHSHQVQCVWSCRVSRFFDQAMPGGMDPAAQLGALKEQLLAQLAAVQGQQRAVGPGMAPTTIAETDRLIQELEATVQQLRVHRAALVRLAGG